MASIVKQFNKKWMVEVASRELQSVAALATCFIHSFIYLI